MEKVNYYRYLFLSGAIWNMFVSITCFFASIFLIEISSFFGMENPPSLFWFHLFFGYIFIFGIGYLVVYQDITKNRGIVLLGISEKFLTFIGSLIYFILGDINLLALLLVVVDLVYGGLYIEFLFKFKTSKKMNQNNLAIENA